ncbi:cell division protein FtsQ/DivIB [Prosthecobacter sp.]|uniref:cell division protein FtsQ/DivIB n=1 Tax=Prosthecobacter sp. TaxID=1965333 RepID=UPI0037834442
MPAAKNGSKKSAKRSPSKRKGVGTHVIDYEPESPVIRKHEAVERRRRGFRTAMWLITAMLVIGVGWVTWHEALEKNSQFLLKTVEVNTAGTLTRQQIVAATGLTEATNLLTMNLRDVRARIERLPQVKSAVIQRDYHGKLTLDVVQRLPVAWIECPKHKLMSPLSGKGCLIDAEGALVPCNVITKEYLAMPRIQFAALSEATPGVPCKDLQMHAALRLMEKLQSRGKDDLPALESIEIPNSWSLVAHFTGEARITFGVDDLDPQLARFDRVMHEARARQWRIATLNLIASVNTPVTFHETPDIAGLNLAETAPTPPAR